jgi:exodeoxyribonuclease X
MSAIQDAAFCVIDIETTGLDPVKDKICEIAFVITTLTEVVHAVDTLVNPGIPIPAFASAIHHIVDSDVVNAPVEMPYGIKLPKRHCYVAHNARFDSSFLPHLSNKPWICTMRLAKRLMPQWEHFGNQYLRYSLGLKVELPQGSLPHRALPDALVTAALLRHLLAKLPEEGPGTVGELTAWVAEPFLLKTCKFGKLHRGKPWAEVPKDYLRWMHNQCSDLDVDTLHTVRHYLEGAA